MAAPKGSRRERQETVASRTLKAHGTVPRLIQTSSYYSLGKDITVTVLEFGLNDVVRRRSGIMRTPRARRRALQGVAAEGLDLLVVERHAAALAEPRRPAKKKPAVAREAGSDRRPGTGGGWSRAG